MRGEEAAYGAFKKIVEGCLIVNCEDRLTAADAEGQLYDIIQARGWGNDMLAALPLDHVPQPDPFPALGSVQAGQFIESVMHESLSDVLQGAVPLAA